MTRIDKDIKNHIEISMFQRNIDTNSKNDNNTTNFNLQIKKIKIIFNFKDFYYFNYFVKKEKMFKIIYLQMISRKILYIFNKEYNNIGIRKLNKITGFESKIKFETAPIDNKNNRLIEELYIPDFNFYFETFYLKCNYDHDKVSTWGSSIRIGKFKGYLSKHDIFYLFLQKLEIPNIFSYQDSRNDIILKIKNLTELDKNENNEITNNSYYNNLSFLNLNKNIYIIDFKEIFKNYPNLFKISKETEEEVEDIISKFTKDNII